MGLIKGLLWWGYLDSDGLIHVKRYTNDRVIRNYEQMPYTKGIFDVFEAFSYEDAKRKCYERYKEERVMMKKDAN